jgi:eukaryotic-like serine/threonine-protein kinase
MAIAKEPARRFQTADAFRAALGNVSSLPAALELGATAAFGGPPVAAGPVQPIASSPLQPAIAPQDLQYVAAPPQYAAGPQAPPYAPPAPRGRRGLYMAVGSLATIAVLVLLAIQAPKFFGTSAQVGEPGDPAVQSEPAQQAAEPLLPPASDPGAASIPEPPATATAAPATAPMGSLMRRTPAPSQGSQGVRQQAGQATSSPSESQTPFGGPAAGSAPDTSSAYPAASAPASRQAPVAAAAPAVNAAEKAEIADLRQRMMLMAVRANAVKSSMQRLQQEQAARGLGMRGDATAADQRMNFLMDQAEAALAAGNPAAARKNLDGAERQLENLEKILGL